MFSRRSSKRLRLWPRLSNRQIKTVGATPTVFPGNAMKFKIPEIKIPKVSIPKLHRKAEDDEQISYEEVDPEQNGEGVDDSNTADNEVFDELDSAEAPEEAPAAEPQPQNKPKSYGMVISEDQLRMVWAGEIGFSLLIVLASVLIAIAS